MSERNDMLKLQSRNDIPAAIAELRRLASRGPIYREDFHSICMMQDDPATLFRAIKDAGLKLEFLDKPKGKVFRTS